LYHIPTRGHDPLALDYMVHLKQVTTQDLSLFTSFLHVVHLGVLGINRINTVYSPFSQVCQYSLLMNYFLDLYLKKDQIPTIQKKS